ncbi:hypothetical protein F441_16808 [Phytophthora nicotianae CJ01A1]|uniref:RxLR effector protein n=3 Tax=Phytophthora nicotianae TaxID=4792 RepID=W2PND6_PHYN3|nr:hypothetical protein PPTG_16456 [Phytophthora nicotianae INRA-310]ETK77244.1 hypothetical protein L915_16488 [Phytophthora nicotianae]ETP06882.1 hypothetical protein F441_16808 [Phytophthora nicotianae CJ01A1]KUF78823.1 hypothetical protein AM587_10002500 [Phytophthora nicotianae]ETL30671.1 hypothetical protein L916_16389 [Phytophthora nicotianae]ETM37098.1 hypothetical protein L914_16320 [Phytophthora nicotianae]
MAWELFVLVGTAITLVNILATSSLATSIALDDKNIDTSGRFLRVVKNDEERTVASAETITSLVKSKSVINTLVDTLPSKLAEIEKKYPIVIPGVSQAYIKVRLRLAYSSRTPPTEIFRFLGLRGHHGERLKNHPFYKYYEAYFNKWKNAQKHLSIR